MAYALRIIKKNRWYRDVENYPGKEQDDVPADTLLDFATKQNELSFWLVDDQQTNVQRLIAALAANRDRLDAFDYILFDFISVYPQSLPKQKKDAKCNQRAVRFQAKRNCQRWGEPCHGLTGGQDKLSPVETDYNKGHQCGRVGNRFWFGAH